MQFGSTNFGDDALSRCILFDFTDTEGPVPAARWGHTAVLLGNAVYVYGGIGAQSFGDLLCFELGKTKWQLVETRQQQDAPPSMYGQAACGVGTSMYLYGGRQGRKFLHTLYQFSLESNSWEVCKAGSTAPPALAAHTLTAVGQHGIFCFGGQGKKVYNAVHKLDPSTCRWDLVKTIGTQPIPRHGHTAVWDNSDSLIVFGGTNSTGQCLSDVHILSLSTGYWSNPHCSGDIPRARANHTAVMWTANLMLIFGGCNPTLAGRFMNDVHVLDILAGTWYELDSLGTAPAPRYWHTCVASQGKAFVFGGSNATQIFDRMFSISSDWSRELNEVAGELARMSNQSGGRTQAPSASQMGMQLGNLLEQKANREAAEAETCRHQRTKALLQEERQKALDLAAEITQLNLLQEEQQDKHAKEKAHAQSKAHRLEKQCQQLTSSLQSAHAKNEELLKAAQQHREQSATLASLRANLASMQQQFASLQDECSGHQSQYRQLQEEYRESQQKLREQTDELLTSKAHIEHLQHLMSNKVPKQLSLQADSSLMVIQAQAISHQQSHAWLSEVERNAVESTQNDAFRLHHTHQEGKFHDTHPQRAAELLAVNTASVQELMQLSIADLHNLEITCQTAVSNVVAASRQKALIEVSRLQHQVSQLEASADDRRTCPLCMEVDKDVVLNCGHQTCQQCSKSLAHCPFCSIAISLRIRMF